ncbi:uncharacterized protein LOC143283542 [Babylonia areolata]|uniref:uncharacterized protein LOC143283542 n=1 Tax=Babylonia areolata TaxID=304850 RepID=UPI003FCF4B7E
MRRGQRKQQGKAGLQFLTPIFSIHSLLKDLLKLQKSTQKPNRRHNRSHRGGGGGTNHRQHHQHHHPSSSSSLPTTSSATALSTCTTNLIDCSSALGPGGGTLDSTTAMELLGCEAE